MSRIHRAVGVLGGVLGAAVAGTAVGVVARGTRDSRNRRVDDDPFSDEPLGELPPDRECAVAAEDGVPLSVEEVFPADGGRAELTVILVHGYTLDRRSWHFQRRDLPKLTKPRVRLVLYDQRSHGRSGRSTRRACTIAQLGADLAEIIRTMVPEGPLVLVGHSMGGMAIMALAERDPELFADRVRGVAFINTSAGRIGGSGLPRPVLSRHNPFTYSLAQVARWQPELVEWVRGVGDGIAWGVTKALAFGDRQVSPSLVDLMDRMISATSVRVITDFLPTLGTHDRFAALPGLRHCHVTVIGGDADKLTPFEHSEAIVEILPDTELVVAAGAGHMAMLEQPGLITQAIVELIRICEKPKPRRRLRRAP